MLKNPFSISAKAGAPFLRHMLLVAVFVGICVSFWYNFERRFDELVARNSISDKHNILTEQGKDALHAVRRQFHEDWGVSVLLHITKGAITLPELENDTLFLGVNTETPLQAVLIVPPLMRRSIASDVRANIEDSLKLCMNNQPADACLFQALDTLHHTIRQQ